MNGKENAAMLRDFFKQIFQPTPPFRFDFIQVEVSALCNASCPYCVHGCYGEIWGGSLMEMDTFRRLQRSFGSSNLVFLQGWGEPLLHPRIWEMVRMVKEEGTKVGFTTNGTLLTAENRQHVMDSGLDIMGISLAGATPETHKIMRRGISFEALDAALKAFRKLRGQSHGKSPNLHIAFMLLKSNWQELDMLLDLADRWGVNEIVISNLDLVASREMEGESLLIHSELWQEVVADLEKTKEAASKMGIHLHYYRPDIGDTCAQCKENILRSCVISYEGNVTPCVMVNISLKGGDSGHFFFKGQPHSVEKYIFGNVNEAPLEEIWNSEKARQFRADFRKRMEMKSPGTQCLPGPCQSCYKLLSK